MSIVKTSLAIASAVMLSSCGGGASTESPQAPAATDTRLKAQSASAVAAAESPFPLLNGVSPDEAVRQLLNFGEAQYPSRFPMRVETQTSGPFRYRYYAGTGTYLGVVVQPDPVYDKLYGVYVMGGPFGAAPVYVGLLTEFISPTNGPGPDATSNGCVDLSSAEAVGMRREATYEVKDFGVNYAETREEVVGELVLFEGQLRRERITTITSSKPLGGGTQQIRSYFLKTGPGEITEYGSTSTVESGYSVGTTTTTTTVQRKNLLSAPWADRHYALTLGEALTNTTTTVTTGTSTTTSAAPGQTPTTTNSTIGPDTTSKVETVTYLRREAVVVPAGTFNACVYQVVDASAPTVVTTRWHIIGSGVMVQELKSNGSETRKAIVARLNGVRLPY